MGGYPVYQGTGGSPPFPSNGGYPVFIGDASVGAGGNVGVGGFINNPCGDPSYVPWPAEMDGGDPTATCALCAGDAGPSSNFSCEKTVLGDGLPYLKCSLPCIGGRRPEGLSERTVPGTDELCGYFQEMSRLEAASVPAFRTLAHELRAHGAPRSLRRAARRAARDEIRHARQGTTLARRFGGTYQRPHIVPKPLRTVEEIARDNATEGCVRETFGAMVATWQSRAAADPVVRRIMRSVAADETRHAALALRVAEWAERRLDAAARERVREARRVAGQTVLRELEFEPSPALVALGGLPTGEQARELATALYERLWA